MTSSPLLDHNSRLLVIVPHPDDETLATGGLIQMALTAGARLRVIMATDGDNNPWPQRWIEKRWHIDASARARWGSRRRAEAMLALSRLGVAAQDVRCLGWPDQGITTLLMHDSAATMRLAAEIVEFAPNLIVAPSLADRHPDHNAMGVMLELAVAGSISAKCVRLAYVVHGNRTTGNRILLPASHEHSEAKLDALREHTSQLALSGRRMTKLGLRPEQFESIEAQNHREGGPGILQWRMSLPSTTSIVHRHALYLIAEVDGQWIRAKVALPRLLSSTGLDVAIGETGAVRLYVQYEACGLRVKLTGAIPIRSAFAKIERLGWRLLIYDSHGWDRAGG